MAIRVSVEDGSGEADFEVVGNDLRCDVTEEEYMYVTLNNK